MRKNAAKTTQSQILGRFCSDLSENNMLHAVLVRADKVGDTMTGVAVPELPPDYAFFSAADIPHGNGIDIAGARIPVFCDGAVLYEGQPAGILCGTDMAALQSIAREIRIEYAEEQEPPAGGEPAILAERTVRQGDADAALEAAELVVESQWRSRLSLPACTETDGALCKYRAGTLTVLTPSRWAQNLRRNIERILGLSQDKVIIRKTNTISQFSENVWHNTQLACQTALAAFRTGRPVRLILSRAEQETFVTRPVDVRITHRTAVRRDGRFSAMKVDVSLDAGAFSPLIKDAVDRLAVCACGVYAPETLLIRVRALSSPLPPAAVQAQRIGAHVFAAAETHVNEIARRGGFFPQKEIPQSQTAIKGCHDVVPPVERSYCLPIMIRAANIHDTAKRDADRVLSMSCRGALDALFSVCRGSDFVRKYEAFSLSAALPESAARTGMPQFDVPVRGKGIACCFDGAGFYGSGLFRQEQAVEVTLDSDSSGGNFVEIRAAQPSESVAGIWRDIAAGAFGIEAQRVRINGGEGPFLDAQMPETEYNPMGVMTELVRKCCAAIQKKRFREKLPMTVRKGIGASRRRQWSAETFSGAPFHSVTFAACSLELEIDPCALRPRITEIALAVSAGKIYNRAAAENSLRLSVQKVLSALVQDDTVECAGIKVQFLPSDSAAGQIDNLALGLVPAAFASALAQALRESPRCIPINMRRLLAARLQSDESAEAKEEETEA